MVHSDKKYTQRKIVNEIHLNNKQNKSQLTFEILKNLSTLLNRTLMRICLVSLWLDSALLLLLFVDWTLLLLLLLLMATREAFVIVIISSSSKSIVLGVALGFNRSPSNSNTLWISICVKTKRDRKKHRQQKRKSRSETCQQMTNPTHHKLFASF